VDVVDEEAVDVEEENGDLVGRVSEGNKGRGQDSRIRRREGSPRVKSASLARDGIFYVLCILSTQTLSTHIQSHTIE